MADVIDLFPHRQFTDGELSALCSAVMQCGWQVYFVHYHNRREQALVYRVAADGQDPDWVIDKSRGLWTARDCSGRKIAAATDPRALIGALAGTRVAIH